MILLRRVKKQIVRRVPVDFLNGLRVFLWAAAFPVSPVLLLSVYRL